MGWSWADYENTPARVVGVLVEKLTKEVPAAEQSNGTGFD
jgi:hypothetical protein